MIRTLICAALIAAAPVAALAKTVTDKGCSITAPDSWGPYHGGVGSAGDKIWAHIRQAPTAAEARAMLASLGLQTVYDNPKMTLMFTTASFAGQTNKQYWAVLKTAPSCLVNVSFPVGPLDAQGKAVAESLRAGS